jgi:hypothetical protein
MNQERPTGGSPPAPHGGPTPEPHADHIDPADPADPADLQLPMPEVTTALASVEELTAASHGIWLVLTRHTVHVLDLDLHIYERRPGPDGSRFPFDFTPVRYSHIERQPTRGSRMLVWFDDPDFADLREHYRYSSSIRAIVGWAGNTDAPTGEVGHGHRTIPFERAAEHADRVHRASRSSTGTTDERQRIGARGSWRVETVNSDYLIDLDAGTATRNPLEPGPLRGDGQPISLLEVICAEVGLPLILRLRHPRSAVETVRYGTAVLRIHPS